MTQPARQRQQTTTSAQNQALEAARLAEREKLVRSAVHELSNPANFITLNVQVLKKLYADLVTKLDAYQQKHGDFPVAGIMYSCARTDISVLLSGIEEGAIRINRIIHTLRECPQTEQAAVKLKKR